jgi:hypothetical protein
VNVRQTIIRYVTDRPGEVIYRDEIIEATGCAEKQITDVMRRIQVETSLGDEIETVVRGRAWRYVPNRSLPTHAPSPTIPVTPSPPNRALPLTTLIREYLVAHQGKIVHLDELTAYTGHQDAQVKVGVNNMRRIMSNEDVTAYLETIVSGLSWRSIEPRRRYRRS